MTNRANGNANIDAWREIREWERRFSDAVAALAGAMPIIGWRAWVGHCKGDGKGA